MSVFNPVDLIIKKRDRGRLTGDEFDALVRGYVSGEVAEYQMSAFLMAGFLNGLDASETFALTRSMLRSGTVVDLSNVPGIKVDKHSTGGVGDKISLVLAPVVAACGVPVPMISGRGLGHTGGTLDKLESIPGFNVRLSTDAYRRQLEEIGISMIGQTDDIAPADRELYALRDVTGTVECVPFIASSIMSKKLAEGIDALVLDVKCGRGAFMKDEHRARNLAETLVGIGEQFEKRTVALLTDMEAPLGYAVGNWPEMHEALRCLHGDVIPDVNELVLALAGEMIHVGGQADTVRMGRQLAKEALDSGAALQKFVELVEAQGGDPALIHEPDRREGFEPAGELLAPDGTSSYIAGLDAEGVGRTALLMGAGRRRKEDLVDPLAGIVFAKKPGDRVMPGETLAQLYTRDTADLELYRQRVLDAFSFSDQPPPARPSIIIDRFSEGAWELRD